MRVLSSLVMALVAVAAATRPAGAAQPLKIVAAENFYGDVAAQIGGNNVEIVSILSNPDQDPHLFEVSPSTARALSDATITIYNDAGYDPWMQKLLAASPKASRAEIVAADLIGAHAGDNPHIWYDPKTLPAVGTQIAAALEQRDPTHAAIYKQNLATFEASFKPLTKEVEAIAAEHAGTPVTATEPVFGYMAKALGFTMLNAGFQTAVMNDAEPSASQVAAFEDSLRSGKVKILFYNKQVTDKATERLLQIAKDAKVPVVGVTETKPKNVQVQAWLQSQLSDVKRALAGHTM